MTKTADTAWLRKMLMAELEEQADWRRQKAVEYPLDRRNRDAAAEYRRLAKTVKDIPDDVLVAYSKAFEDAPDSASSLNRYSSFQPARRSLPASEPLVVSLRATLSARRRMTAMF